MGVAQPGELLVRNLDLDRNVCPAQGPNRYDHSHEGLAG
jgi:hypothetical protein